MRIIIDTNILLSALISDSVTRRILLRSKSKFYYPEEALKEVAKHRGLILKKTKLTNKELDILLAKVLENVEIVQVKDYLKAIKKAERIMDNIDPSDSIFVALAFAIPNSVIWSRDKHLREQRAVNVVDTDDLRELRPEFIKKMKKIETEEFVRYASVEEFKKEFK